MASIGSFEHTLHPQPMIHGERFTFKPTRNLRIWFLPDRDLRGRRGAVHSGLVRRRACLVLAPMRPANPRIPGDRRSGMDWSYRVPCFAIGLTFYGDAFADDQISPIAYLDRSAIRGGLYLSRICRRIPKARSAGRRRLHGFARRRQLSATAFSTPMTGI